MEKKLNAVVKAVYGENEPEEQQPIKKKASKKLDFDEDKGEGYQMTNYDLIKKDKTK